MLVRHKANQSYHALKILSKSKVVKMKQVEHTLNEKRVMASISFPFLISLDYHFKVGERRVWQETRREEGGVEDGGVEEGRRGGRFCNGRMVYCCGDWLIGEGTKCGSVWGV